MKMIERIEPNQTALFLFNYSKRQLFGVYEAPSPGGLNLEPEAWKQTGSFVPQRGKGGNMMTNNKTAAEESPFPAQAPHAACWLPSAARAAPSERLTAPARSSLQVRFSKVHDFPPLHEKFFTHIVRYKGNTHNFEFMLDAQQVAELMEVFLKLEDAIKKDPTVKQNGGR